MRKLTDAQVKTMIHILVYSPDVPTNLERFPTLRMMLENGIIERQYYAGAPEPGTYARSKLVFNTKCEENAYQYVVPTNFVDDSRDAPSFDELEKAGMLAFNPSAEPRLTTETDEEYRNRLINALVPNAVMTSKDIVNAVSEGLDAIGKYLRCYRLLADTFYYWDCIQLCSQLEELSAEVDVNEGRIVFPEGTSPDKLLLGNVLVDAFKSKYPQTVPTDVGEMSCPGTCEPMCAWCNAQADIAAANRSN